MFWTLTQWSRTSWSCAKVLRYEVSLGPESKVYPWICWHNASSVIAETQKIESTHSHTHARTHTCTHARTHAHTHARTHTHNIICVSPNLNAVTCCILCNIYKKCNETYVKQALFLLWLLTILEYCNWTKLAYLRLFTVPQLLSTTISRYDKGIDVRESNLKKVLVKSKVEPYYREKNQQITGGTQSTHLPK